MSQTQMIEQGAVVEYPALFEFDSYPRPYLIISTDAHPFAGDEYIGVAITTTDLDPAILIQDEMWVTGGLPKQSYIKPWQPILLEHDKITDAYVMLDIELVGTVITQLESILGQHLLQPNLASNSKSMDELICNFCECATPVSLPTS